jgi:hypothetical protein
MPDFHLATFAADVTPPLGHPLCGGWIPPVRAVDDPLRALGVVLLGSGAPIVLCAIDWVGIRNDAHLAWRVGLAKAAHTTPERIHVHCVHPHDAPFADTGAQKLIEATPGCPSSLDLKFHHRAVNSVADAIKKSLVHTSRVTHYGIGQSKVEQVASNRRIIGPDGKSKATRTSATRDPKVRAEPEGLIDPWLKQLTFFDEKKTLATMNYYATHPMSHYGQGRVSCDFCGLARDKRAWEDDKVFQAYFTGCAGNVTAGKYNDGDTKNRVLLRDRMYEGMKAAWKATVRHPLKNVELRVEPIKLAPRREKNFQEEASKAALADPKATTAKRNNSAYQLAWLARLDRAIDLTVLDLGEAMVLHLPGEPFVEYQLRAQEMRKDRFICVAGYGDDGPGYIPTDKGYLEGGYEPTVALAAPSEKLLIQAMAKLVKGKA